MEPLRAADPRQVGKYRLLGRLGAGGMGEVFLGESPGRRKVAVKLLKPEHAGDAHFRERFTREVAAAKMVSAFHTAPVVDADPDSDPPWLVTAYIAGPSLADAVRRNGPLDPDAVRLLGAALAEGLAAIHACGLIHRDLKPANVICADDGPRIIDFGVARTPDAPDLTSTGFLVGTISYMSPEQVSGARVDARSDVFSLGGVLAYAATGHGPFDAPSIPAIASRITGEAPDTGGIPSPLRETIEACLSKDPAARPGLEAVTSSLTGAAAGHPDTYVVPSRGPGPRDAPVSIPRPPGPVAPAPAPQTPGPAPQPAGPGSGRKRLRTAALAAAAVAVAAGIGVGANLLTSGGQGKAKQPGVTATASVSPAASRSPAATSSPAGAALPSRYVGRWSGTLNSEGLLGGPTSATLTVTSAAGKGADAGRADYPTVGCTYAFQLVSAQPSQVVLRENVKSGPCFSEYVVLAPAPAGDGLTDNVYETLPADGGTPTFTGTLSPAS